MCATGNSRYEVISVVELAKAGEDGLLDSYLENVRSFMFIHTVLLSKTGPRPCE